MIRLVFQCEAPLRANRRRAVHPSSRHGTFSASVSVRRPRGLRCLASLWSAPEDILQRRLASHGIPKLKQRNFLQNILESVEPFDTSELKQDASPHAYDAMKRAISGMLGLLPSEQFQVTVQTPVEALSRVLVSAMYTGYTLKEAEYRMKMEQCMPLDSPDQADAGDIGLPSERLADLEDDVRNYIRYIEQKLAAAEEQAPGGAPGSVAQEEPSRVATLASLGSEGPGNPLLDYLNVLDGDTAAHMSAPNSPEVDRAFHGVVNTLLGRLSRNDEQLLMDSHDVGHSAQGSNAQLVQEQTQSYETSVTASRDALARLLYWCMLMGHWTRYLEYKLQLESAFDGDAEGRQGTEAGAEAEKEDSEGQGIFGMIGSLFGGADDDGNGGEREDEDESKAGDPAGGDDAGAKPLPAEGQGGGDAGGRGISSERVTGAGDNDERVL